MLNLTSNIGENSKPKFPFNAFSIVKILVKDVDSPNFSKQEI